MSAPDRLYIVRSQFFIGNFETCIQEAERITNLSEGENLEKLCYVYRSMIALGKYADVISAIDASEVKTAELNAIACLAKYFQNPEEREKSIQAIGLLLNEEFGNTSLVRIIACTVYNNENDYEHAYQVVFNAESLEELSVLVYTLVRMNRPDKAITFYNKMVKIDEDHILTQLSKSWINIKGDNEKMKENTYIYREMMDKLNESTMLVNNWMISTIRCDGNACDTNNAEKCYAALQEEYTKNPKEETVLSNLVVLSTILHKSDEAIEKLLMELKTVNPKNTLVATTTNMMSRLEQLQKEYA